MILTRTASGYLGFLLSRNFRRICKALHIRRKFLEVMGNDAPRATYELERMQALYAIERRIKEESLSPDQIIALRQSESLPVLKELKEWMLAQVRIVLPKSSIGQAITYSLKRWDKLSIYTTNARLQIDSNSIKREMCPVALGRKNYMFAGSHDAAQRSDMIYSLFATCRLHKINPDNWLKDVLKRMPIIPQKICMNCCPKTGNPLTMNNSRYIRH
jgi:transposase